MRGTIPRPHGAVAAQMMNQVDHSRYRKIDGGAVALLACKDWAELVVVVPDSTSGLARLEEQVAAGALPTWIGETEYRKVEWMLPRMKLKQPQSMDLTSALQTLGLAFGGAGDLAEMVTPSQGDYDGITLGAVLHQVCLDIDEHGMEAAAATAVMGFGGAPRMDEPVPVHCDRPFLWAIRHGPTRTILFIGRITDPSAPLSA